LLAGTIEGCDFERLRNRLLHYCPELLETLAGDDLEDELAPARQDLFGFNYLMAGASASRKKTASGFRGGFFMATEPIGQAAFRTFIEHTGYDYPAEMLAELAETHALESPMACLTWQDAAAYCRWLSQESGIYYTLPYKEEWAFAGECLADRWPQTDLPEGLQEKSSKWLPPGLDSYGELRADQDQLGPGSTGMIWEWCCDKESLNGDVRTLCTGIWPNAKDAHSGSRVREHSVNDDERVPTAGFRPIALTNACLWHTNRGMIGDGRDASPIGEYLKSVMAFDTIPGSVARPDDRPSFYYNLQPDLQARVDAELSILNLVEQFAPAEARSSATAGNPEYRDVEHIGVPSVTRVRPLSERQVDEDHFIGDAPVSTMLILDKALLADILDPSKAPKKEAPKGPIQRLFNRIRKRF
jgi:hypothetical protein